MATEEAPSEKELGQFRNKVASWLSAHLPPRPPFRLPQSFLEVDTKEQLEYLRDWQRKVYEAGFLGISWPKEYGGGGGHFAYQEVVNEEMARVRAPFMFNTIGLFWAGPTILQLGTEAQKRKYVKRILTAEDIWCQGFSEPDNGSDLGNAQIRAVREGDAYVVNGRKIWTTLGHFAQHMILLARTNPDAPNKYLGLSFFLSPMEIPGIEVRPIKKMTGQYGFNETVFDNARIPADTLVGEEGQGWQVAMAVLAFERGASKGQAGGTAGVPFTVAEVAALARRTLRDGTKALDDPLIRDTLVRFAMEEKGFYMNQARAGIDRLLTPTRPMALMIMGKLQGSEFYKNLAAFAVQVQGRAARLYLDDPHVVDEAEWHLRAMNAYGGTIGGGTSEIQKNIIGERLLGLSKG